jgi:hypothetical protein
MDGVAGASHVAELCSFAIGFGRMISFDAVGSAFGGEPQRLSEVARHPNGFFAPTDRVKSHAAIADGHDGASVPMEHLSRLAEQPNVVRGGAIATSGRPIASASATRCPMHPHEPAPSLTLVDTVASVFAAAPAVGLIAFPLVSRTYAKMYKGLEHALPWLTKLCLLPWFPIVLAAVVLALLVAASRIATIWARRMVIAFAFVFGCASLGLCAFAMHQPLIQVGEFE